MLNENQLNDTTYLELHEQVKEMLNNNKEDLEQLGEYFRQYHLTDEDIKELIIMSYLENGMFTTQELKDILSFRKEEQKQKND